MGTDAYKRWATGEGATFQECKQTRIICRKCGITMAASSLCHYMDRIHRKILLQTREVYTGGGGGG